MPTAFETFVNDELPNRVATSETAPTEGNYPRYTGTAKLTLQRTPAQVLSDIGGAAAAHTHTLANVTDVTATAAEVNFTDGVTSAIQTQLDGKQASDADLTAIAEITAAEGFYRKTGAGTATVLKSNLAAAVAPGATDDSAAGYSVGSIWIDTIADNSFICVDATATAAVWNDLTAGGGSTPTGTGFRHVTAGVEEAAAKLVDTADITDGAVTPVKASAPLRERTRFLEIENPTATMVLQLGFEKAAVTLVKVYGETDAGTVTFQIQKKPFGSQDVAGTDMLSASLVASATGVSTTAFVGGGSVGAENGLFLKALAIASGPAKLWVAVTYRVD